VADAPFQFLDLGTAVDAELELIVAERQPAADSIWHVPAYLFRMVHRESREPIGRVSLRIGTTDNCARYAGQIGYAVDEPHRGQHYAERGVRLVLPLARRHGLTELWITSNPDNAASRRTLDRLGAAYVETVETPADYPGEGKWKCRYCLPL
jgi:tagatose 1,6-diphosphate aldolase